MTNQRWWWWRRLHVVASGLLLLLAVLHSGVTAFLYDTWAPRTAWFLGTGLGLLLLAALNLSHIGIEPCRQPTVRLVKAANWVFLVYGVAAVVAVPEPQAVAVLVGLAGQAIAAHATLPGPA